MTKDLLICILSSLNIFLFSFIGFHYEAFKKINDFQVPLHTQRNFDEMFFRLQRKFSNDHLHASANDIPPREPAEVVTLLNIPKLHMTAPVNFPVRQEEISRQLETGTMGLVPFIAPQTPGQNIIFGHSSDYPWKNNDFGTVFTLLPQLQPGDEIIITRGERKYRYSIKKSLVTDAKLTGLIGNVQEHELILSTCYPIGFFNKRFNVIATPI